MALTMAGDGEIMTIQRFLGKEEAVSRLRELGFIPGEKVEVVGRNQSGMVLLVRGVRIALDRSLAGRIIVA